ncbi:expansin EXLX1 family cellulose-binding protein [Mangrovihabitans endophyticus]|uniref:Peptidoglycan-binding domain-containing protein, expansin n=1 Tax=Mangrovihabitans endophyticus TaxID=1751298 RepID=A0A8J3BXC6_9ACTN|nr:expansin EXLX1 family cellulose-binding protein [Mangrovihabitans endophyticus]GGK87342.1 hypothetical protein GCM10012284_21760 [Mangrovihabitans endophyticus]
MTVRPSPRWFATGAAAVVLAAVAALTLLLRDGGAACAAPPSTSSTSGKATFYDLGDGLGHCSFPNPPADDLFVALGDTQYADAAACGSYLDVTGPHGTVRVKVLDSCPECAAGHLDLSRTAFRRIADEVTGIVPISYRTVTGVATSGGLSARIKDGSSQYWFAVLIDNHANALSKVAVSSGGGRYRSASRSDFNYWIIDGGAGPGPFRIKVTDVYGHTATLRDITLSPEKTQKTSARLTGGGSSSTSSAKRAKPAASASPTSRPSPSASPSPSPASPSASPTSASTSTAASAGVSAGVRQGEVQLAAKDASCR